MTFNRLEESTRASPLPTAVRVRELIASAACSRWPTLATEDIRGIFQAVVAGPRGEIGLRDHVGTKWYFFGRCKDRAGDHGPIPGRSRLDIRHFDLGAIHAGYALHSAGKR